LNNPDQTEPDIQKNMKLHTDPNLLRPDDFYAGLMELHRDLTPQQSAKVNAKLILLLANHIGDDEVLRQAMQIARQDITAGPDDD
jgi:hypothetical protein